MAGPRYLDWTHVHVHGDRAAAALLLPYGRKLLGYLAEQRSLGAQDAVIQKVLSDGSVVRAEFIGDLPRITITPNSTTVEATSPLPPGFVVTPRNTAKPSGFDDADPQEILAPATDRWHTFAYTREIAKTIPVAGIGTYFARFPDGLRHGANQDWVSPEGVRLNWYGPSRRYWWDNYRTPDGQYGPWVFLNGAPLLDIEAYFASAPIDEKYVLGAAYRGGWLYVMQAAIADFPDDVGNTVPANYPNWPEPGYSGWFSVPYPPGDTSLALYRYRVLQNPAATGNADLFHLGNAELLWTHTGRGWVNPWFFDPQVTVCESFAMPDELRALDWHWEQSGDETPTPDVKIEPSASSEHAVLTIAEDGVVSAAFDTRASEAARHPTSPGADYIGKYVDCEVAADYAPDGTRIPLLLRCGYFDDYFPSPEGLWSFIGAIKIGAGEWQYLYYSKPFTNPSPTMDSVAGLLMAIDLRHGLYAKLRRVPAEPLDLPSPYGGMTARTFVMCLVKDGEERARIPLGDNAFEFGSINTTPELYDRYGTTVSPLFKICGVAAYFSAGRSTRPADNRAVFGLNTWGPIPGFGSHWITTPVDERRGAYRTFRDRMLNIVFLGNDARDLSRDAVDADGKCTPTSMSVDTEGNVVASVVGFIPEPNPFGPVYQTESAYVGRLKPVAINFISKGNITTVTGLPPDGARFGPIWQISQWPVLN
jgi:hypothetical protein